MSGCCKVCQIAPLFGQGVAGRDDKFQVGSWRPSSAVGDTPNTGRAFSVSMYSRAQRPLRRVAGKRPAKGQSAQAADRAPIDSVPGAPDSAGAATISVRARKPGRLSDRSSAPLCNARRRRRCRDRARPPGCLGWVRSDRRTEVVVGVLRTRHEVVELSRVDAPLPVGGWPLRGGRLGPGPGPGPGSGGMSGFRYLGPRLHELIAATRARTSANDAGSVDI